MNEFLPSSFAESIQRLALGIECQDAMLESRIGWPVDVAVDGVPHPLPQRLRGPDTSPWDEPTSLQVIARRDSCRHAVLLTAITVDAIAVRITDREQRFVPRRLSIELGDPIGAGRGVRPALYPGAAYPVNSGAVGMRGRIVRDGEPMRWARVEARRTPDDVVVGRGAGDEHGEFLLVLHSEARRGADLILPIELTVTVFGPDILPDPADFEAADVDPLWDLPVETVEQGSAGDQVLAGELLPNGYVSRPGSIRDVEFGWHGLIREEFDFS
jgi:hypothetical protein